MIDDILYSIYRLQKPYMVLFAAFGITIWLSLGLALCKKIFRVANILLYVSGIIFVIYYTLISRESSEHYVSFVPFISFQKAKLNEEYYRTMILNFLMFIPFSLGLAGVLPDKIKIGKRMLIVILSGFVLSVSVETLQYIFSLGNTEMDDVIMNTLGSVISALALFVQDKLCKLKNKKSKAGD